MVFRSVAIAAIALCGANAFSVPQKSPLRTRNVMLKAATDVAEGSDGAGPTPSRRAGQPAQDGTGRVIGDYGIFDYGYWLQDPKIPMPFGIKEGDKPQFFEVSQEMIETLERDGVVHVPGALAPEWVDYLREVTMHQVENPHIWSFAGTASKLYDYIQRNVWQTNMGFTRFMYHSPVGSILAQLGQTDEVRISTDLLMVNPNRGFKWHMDNQNGPIDFEDGIRFWITMDDTPADYGAPVYLTGSQRNTAVDDQAVFVDIEMEGLEEYKDKQVAFRTRAGDMLIWHPRCIHKIDGPKSGIWTQYRRVLGGTAAKGGTKYIDKRGTGGVFSDLGKHVLRDGEPLKSAFFPRIYPEPIPQEMVARRRGEVQRDIWDVPNKVGQLFGKMASGKFQSFFSVINSGDNSGDASGEEGADASPAVEPKEAAAEQKGKAAGKPKTPRSPFG